MAKFAIKNGHKLSGQHLEFLILYSLIAGMSRVWSAAAITDIAIAGRTLQTRRSRRFVSGIKVNRKGLRALSY